MKKIYALVLACGLLAASCKGKVAVPENEPQRQVLAYLQARGDSQVVELGKPIAFSRTDSAREEDWRYGIRLDSLNQRSEAISAIKDSIINGSGQTMAKVQRLKQWDDSADRLESAKQRLHERRMAMIKLQDSSVIGQSLKAKYYPKDGSAPQHGAFVVYPSGLVQQEHN
ncbi:hypothetical protein [Hymenobacter koreensis]|uniref:Lipoprotein n=1 Tax=Hymenobacter koreensis TaxID=1084523 RepID=A0ABP8JNM1_9BACT